MQEKNPYIWVVLTMGFRENLKETMSFLNKKYKILSKETGIPVKTLENYTKKDASSPHVENAFEIAKALGVTVEYLVDGCESRKNDNTEILFKNKEFLITLIKLDKNNFEVLVSTAKTLLQMQNKKK